MIKILSRKTPDSLSTFKFEVKTAAKKQKSTSTFLHYDQDIILKKH